MKKLFCDFDDVICENRIMDLANEFLGTDYKFEDVKEGYDFSNLVSDKQQLKNMYRHVIESNFYIGAKIKKDCVETLKKLQGEYEIYILSACLVVGFEDISGIVFKNKFDFICKTLPFINPKNIIFTSAKGVVAGDAVIDDRLVNLNGNFKTKLLFDCVYNKNISDDELKQKGIVRVHNWKEIEKVLTK